MAKRGKYEDVLDGLPKSWGTEDKYQEKVNIRKAEILNPVNPGDGPPLASYLARLGENFKSVNGSLIKVAEGKQYASKLAQAYAQARAVKDLYEDHEYELNLTIEALEQLLTDQYENEGIKNLKLDDGGSVGTQSEPAAKVVDKEAFRQWCVKNGLEKSLQLWPSTTNAMVKEMCLKRQNPPDGVEVEARTKVVLRR